MLFIYENELLLIELKATPFYEGIIDQINSYYADLVYLQFQGKLIPGKINKIILVTGYNSEDLVTCKDQDIQIFAYNAELVLSSYYEKFKVLSQFLEIQSGDHGVVRLGLLQPVLRLLKFKSSPKQVAQTIERSIKTVNNRLAICKQLNLVSKVGDDFYLTDFGIIFTEAGEEYLDNRLSEAQAEILSKFVVENPFFSSTTYTVLSLIEAVFVLAKSLHPVPQLNLQEYFITSVGKTETWRTPKARQTATYIFSNYACELGMLSKVNESFYMSPKGIHAILLLQLNRSIKLIESQR